jgi:hypothetical protein
MQAAAPVRHPGLLVSTIVCSSKMLGMRQS